MTMGLAVALSGMLFTACSNKDKESGTQPTADFTFKIKADLTVIFTNNSEDGESYAWDFGDGATSTDQNPTHKYTDGTKSYKAKLTVTNGSKTDEMEKTVNLPEDAPVVDIDGAFGDWSAVTGYSLPNDQLSNSNLIGINKVKVTSDKNYIYFYAELLKDVTAHFQIYLQLSNSPNVWSGVGQWYWPQSSIEFLAEFAELTRPGWTAEDGDVELKGFNEPHSGDDWPWDAAVSSVVAGSGLFDVSPLTDIATESTVAGLPATITYTHWEVGEFDIAVSKKLVAVEIALRKAILPPSVTLNNVIKIGFASSEAEHWQGTGQVSQTGSMFSYNQGSKVLSLPQ